MKHSRFTVDLQARSGRRMSYDMARTIIKDAYELNEMQQDQIQLLAVGGNTLRDGFTPEQILDMVEYVMRRTRKISRLHLVVVSMLSSLESSPKLDEDFKHCDAILHEKIREYSHVSFIDLKYIFRTSSGQMRRADFDEKKNGEADIHLSPDGARKLAKKIHDQVFTLPGILLK